MSNQPHIYNSKLIKLVRENPCLYDLKHPLRGYGMSDAWKDIAEQLEAPVKETKVRWKALRDRYAKLERNIAKRRAKRIRQRPITWIHYKDLTFLKDHIYRKAGHEDVLDQLSSEGRPQTVVSITTNSEDYEEEELVEEEDPTGMLEYITIPDKGVSDAIASCSTNISNAIEKLVESEQTRHDDYAMYGKVVENKLRKLDSKKAFKCFMNLCHFLQEEIDASENEHESRAEAERPAAEQAKMEAE